MKPWAMRRWNLRRLRLGQQVGMRNQRLFHIYLVEEQQLKKALGSSDQRCVWKQESTTTGKLKECCLQGKVVSIAQSQVRVVSAKMAWDWRFEYRCDFWTVTAQKWWQQPPEWSGRWKNGETYIYRKLLKCGWKNKTGTAAGGEWSRCYSGHLFPPSIEPNNLQGPFQLLNTTKV